MINEVHKIEAKIKEQADQGHGLGGGQTDRHHKPIAEYKSIDELGKLTSDKTCFRDRKYRMKSALKQVRREKEFIKIMEWLENPATKLNGTETMDEIMQQAEDDDGFPQDEDTYKKM